METRGYFMLGYPGETREEIEETILESREVHEVAVIGIPDEILGEKIRAFVVPREGVSLDLKAVERALKKKLPVYKIPSEFLVRDDLPKNESGKVMKQALRDGKV